MADILAKVSVVVGAELNDFKAKMAEARKELRGLVQTSEGLKNIGQSLTTYVSLPLTLLAGAALKTAGDMEALRTGFAATYKGAEPLGTALAKVQELAKLPGLGLREALEGATNLQAAGFSAEQARKSLAAFGNALATVGKGKAELDKVSLALTQINNTPFVQGQDLNQLRQALPQIGEAMKKAFGVTNAEGLKALGISSKQFITTITDEFAKLPAVTGGLKNAFENLSDAGTLALDTLGTALNKSFNLTGLSESFGNAIKGAAEAFAGLSPVVQKAIFVFAGLAAAAGPLLVVVGAIGAAIPAIIAGFTLLAGPVGIAVAAFAALAIGITAFVATSKDSGRAYDDQKSKVQGLHSSLEPLISRYDELKAKTKLNAAEQAELKTVINQITDQVPSAATAFDSYGNALDINAGKARAFVEEQKAVLRGMNTEKIQEQNAKLRELASQIIETQRLLNTPTKTVTTSEEVSDGKFRLVKEQVKLTDEEIAKLRATLRKLNQDFNDGDAYLKSLKGDLLDTGNAAGGAAKKLVEMSDAAKALAKLNEELRLIDLYAIALGSTYDRLGERARALENGIKSLVAVGFAPQGRVILGLTQKLRELGGAYKYVNDSIAPIDIVNPFAKKSKQDIKAEALPVKLKKLDAPAYLQPYYDREDEAAKNFAQSFQNILQQGMAGAAETLGTALGDVIAGTKSIGEGLQSVFDGLLGIVGDFIVQYGKLLITQGTLELASTALASNPFTAGAAIAVGIAAVAAGAAVKSFAGAGNRAGAGGGAGVSPISAGNFGQSSTPQTLKVEVVGTLKGAGRDLIAIIESQDYRRLRTA